MNMKKILFFLLALATASGAGAHEQPCATVCPLRVEVSYTKTVHILFPAAVRYVDLGSSDLVAGKTDGAENVLRIKAAVKGFEGETNFSVITDDGVFYAFDAVYDQAPARLTILMQRPTDSAQVPEAIERPYVRLQELGDEDPQAVIGNMRRIHEQNARPIRNIGSKRFGIQFLLRSIYAQGDLLYLHTSIRNGSNIDYRIERIRFRIADRKVARRTALQETPIEPVRMLQTRERVPGGSTLRNVYVFRMFAIPDDKVLVVDLFERDGGRHLCFTVQHSDLMAAPALYPQDR